jgi:putative DNA-invertase from lambdoid prophage Rac
MSPDPGQKALNTLAVRVLGVAVYGYCRVLTLKQANEGESLDVQRRQIEGYALMYPLTLADVLIEEDVSL